MVNLDKLPMRNAIIAGIGAYAPERVVPNTYFNELLGEDVDNWLRENVQIYERRWCAPDESTADLCGRPGWHWSGRTYRQTLWI